MGLGPAHTISLAEARQKAAECRRAVLDGRDPIEERHNLKELAAVQTAKRRTFAQAAAEYIHAHGAGFRNRKHLAQWTSTLETYAYPIVGDVDVAEVDTALVLRVLEPIWLTKTETATRVRGRMEAVMDSAKALGQREGDNPARWRGHLNKLLPTPRKLKKVKHHAALPFERIRVFMVDLQKRKGISGRALEFKILTATRSIEVRGAKWSEIDLKERIWTIPAERMKAGLVHRVPLSNRAVALLKSLPRIEGSDHLFPAPKGGQLSDAALGKLMDDIHEADVNRGGIGYMDPKQNKIATPHGTARSSFKDWARSCKGTEYSDEVSELALAHVNSDATRAAYARDELMSQRAKLMADWESYCYPKKHTKGRASRRLRA